MTISTAFKLSEPVIRLLGVGAVLIVLVLFGRKVLNDYADRKMQEAVAVADEQAKQNARKITKVAEDLSGQQQANTDALDRSRTESEAIFERAYNEKPEVRAAADTPVPAELRQLAEARAKERRRLDCAAYGRTQDGGTEVPCPR